MESFPNIFELIEMLAPWRGMPAAYLVLGAAAVVVVSGDWRLALFALEAHYLAAGLLFVDILDPRLSVIKVLVGTFICLMLYLAARSVVSKQYSVSSDQYSVFGSADGDLRGPALRLGRLRLGIGLLLRVALVLVAVVVVWMVAFDPAYALPGVTDPARQLAVDALIGLGLLGMSLTTEPLKAGMGVLMFFTGFELFYNGLEQSVALLVGLAAVNLALAVAVSYLAQGRWWAVIRNP